MSHLQALTVAAMLPACLGAPDVGPVIPGGGLPPLEPTFSSINALILSPRCAAAACHGGAGGTPPSLLPEAAYLDLLGVASDEAPGVALVAPSQPEASYLLLKLQGRQASVGGTGSQMPPDGDLLSDDELPAVETWILAGAPND
jgi:hypothetical protein